MTYRAMFAGKVIASASDGDVKHVEGNVYFPPDSVDRSVLSETATHTRCPWKGRASYFDVTVGEEIGHDAAFFYPRPWPLARGLRNYVAFWHGVSVEKT